MGGHIGGEGVLHRLESSVGLSENALEISCIRAITKTASNTA